MAEIIQLSERRKKPPLTIHEITEEAVDAISGDWERFARLNRLNDYFVDTAGIWVDEGVNYLNDLNAIASIESKVGVPVIIKAPFGPHLGWRASFSIKTGTVTTPDMPFETYARCFNVLLFLKLKRDLLAGGYADEL